MYIYIYIHVCNEVVSSSTNRGFAAAAHMIIKKAAQGLVRFGYPAVSSRGCICAAVPGSVSQQYQKEKHGEILFIEFIQNYYSSSGIIAISLSIIVYSQ